MKLYDEGNGTRFSTHICIQSVLATCCLPVKALFGPRMARMTMTSAVKSRASRQLQYLGWLIGADALLHSLTRPPHAASAHPHPSFLTPAHCCAMPTTELLASNGAIPTTQPLKLKPALNGHTTNSTSDRLQIIDNEKQFTCVELQPFCRLVLKSLLQVHPE